MYKIRLICVGKIKEDYLTQAVNEYCKRISKYANIEIIEVKECKITDETNQTQINRSLLTEAEAILSNISGTLIVCDSKGKQPDNIELSNIIKNYCDKGTVSIVIGSSHGLDKSVKDKADLLLSMGRLTLPHQLMRVVLVEQIYRSLTIINDTNYHK